MSQHPPALVSEADWSHTWALVRSGYCDTTESVAKICARLGVKERELYRRLDAEGWGRRSAKPGFVNPFKRSKASAVAAPDEAIIPVDDAVEDTAVAPRARPRMRGTVPAKRPRRTAAQKRSKAALALRLYNALDLKLTQLEALMASNSEKSTIDQGRQTRAISQLIKAFERVTEYDPDLLKSASLAGLDPNSAPDGVLVQRAATDTAPGATAHPIAPLIGYAAAPDATATEQLRGDIAKRIERLVALRAASENTGGT